MLRYLGGGEEGDYFHPASSLLSGILVPNVSGGTGAGGDNFEGGG